jgi:hypothetical protein
MRLPLSHINGFMTTLRRTDIKIGCGTQAELPF